MRGETTELALEPSRKKRGWLSFALGKRQHAARDELIMTAEQLQNT